MSVRFTASQTARSASSCALLVSLLALFACVPRALPQGSAAGGLTGTVTDPSGGVIAGVTVTVTSLATGQQRVVKTDASGLYTLSLLPTGNYRMRFDAPNFKPVEIDSIVVNVTETHVQNVRLEIGTQSQQVTVAAAAVATLNTENAAVGTLVAGQTINELPLSTRNFTQIMDLSPGVVANAATATAVGNGTMDINVNGSGSDQNTYMMDGVITTNYGSGGAAQSGSYAGIPIPNPDSIQEFKVQTSQYDAAYGQNPGANVNVVTKSGTNQYHGAIWYFNRNNFFNANDFFYKRSEKAEELPNSPPELKQNQFGFTLGGPIKKDKLFFFGSYQGLRQLNGIGSNGFATAITAVGLLPFNEPGVPFAKARSDGNVGTIPEDYIAGQPPCTYATYRQYLGCAFANQFDLFGGTGEAVNPTGSNISNTAINYLRQTETISRAQGGFNNGFYIPSLRYDSNGLPVCMDPSIPNRPACSTPTTISQATTANENQYMLNSDYLITSKNTLTEKYFFSSDPQIQSFSCIVTGCYPGAPENAQYGAQSLVLRLTSVVTNNFVNEVWGSFQRLYLNVQDGVTVQSCAGDGITPLNITPGVNNGTPCPPVPAASQNRENFLVPIIGVLGFPGSPWGSWSAGGNFFSATKSIQNSYLGGDQISWNHGKHSIRAGGNFQYIRWNWAQPNRARGWVVAGNTADILTSSSGPAIDGTPAAPINWIINLSYRLLPQGSPNPHNWRIPEYATFVQDDFKVSPKLTVNLGLRWEYDGWPTDVNGIFTNFTAQNAGVVNTGSFFLNNPGGTLAGYLIQSNYNKAFYGNLTGQFGSTGIAINSNKTLLYSAPLDNFAPRIGVAWQPLGPNFVVRAGYGFFFDRVYGNLVGDNILGNMPPYATGIGTISGQTLQDPFCPQCPQFQGFIPRTLKVAAGSPVYGTTSITDAFGGNGSGTLNSGDDPAMRTPKVQQYNLDLQYEFARGWIADVGYVGTHGIHLYDWNRNPNLAYLVAGAPDPPTDQVDINLERPASSFPMNDSGNTNPATQVLANTAAVTGVSAGNYLGRVAYLGVNPGNLQQVKTDGNHLYNALQAQLKHQFAHGLYLQASYTWSKLITDINASVSGAGIATPGNVLSGSASSNDPLNDRQQYGLAAFNRPQRFVVSYSYQFPFHADGLKGKFVGGWALSGVTTLQDGLPFSVTEASGVAATLLWGTSIPATGPYARAELADPVNCNSLGNCKSGIPLNTSGSLTSRVLSGLAGTPGGGFINQAAFGNLPEFGGVPSGTPGPYTSACTAGPGLNPQFVGCGTGFGNSGVGIMSCCTQFNWDAAIIKNTTVGGIREDGSLQFRAEFFNIWNHAQFNPPNNGRDSAGFGTITSSSVPGRVLQFGLKYLF